MIGRTVGEMERTKEKRTGRISDRSEFWAIDHTTQVLCEIRSGVK